MKILYSAILIILFSAISNADSEKGQIKSLMHNFVLELSKLRPYIATEKDFSSPQAKESITKSLSVLAKKTASPPESIKSPTGFRISFSLLAEHISKTKQFYDNGEYEYARMRLNSLTNLCASCHTQLPELSKGSPFSNFSDINETINFENANFLFTVRQYDQALSQLNSLARKYPASGLPSDRLSEVYRKKLAIFARVKRDPDLGLENLKEDLRNRSLPADIKQNIKTWISGFEAWQKSDDQPELLPVDELIKYVHKKMPAKLNRNIAPSDPNLLNLLRLSGILYERLYTEEDSDSIQKILYHLATTERSLAPLTWYSLNEIYLKECVVRFPKKPYTKKCFDAYKEGMQERYFNRPLPENIKTSIEALKEYL